MLFTSCSVDYCSVAAKVFFALAFIIPLGGTQYNKVEYDKITATKLTQTLGQIMLVFCYIEFNSLYGYEAIL